MKQLIVNADDFALSRGVTEGIIEAHRRGIVTSTSIMAPGSAFDYAVEQARLHESLGVGVHLTLVEERPVCHPGDIGTLVQRNGRLPMCYTELLSGLLLGRIRLQHVEKELRAQVAKCAGAGFRLTHLDSHQHVHALPSILRMVLDIAGDYGIRGIRIPRDSPRRRGAFRCDRFLGKAALCLIARYDARALRNRRVSACDRMAGLFDSGTLTEDRLLRILGRVSDGTTELVCHPGRVDLACRETYSHWGYQWEAELDALTSESVGDILRAKNIELINYHALRP